MTAQTREKPLVVLTVRKAAPLLAVSPPTLRRWDAVAKFKSRRAVVLELKWEDARAECVVHDGQFIVRAGSTARVKEVDSLADGPRALRRTLRETGVLVPRDGTSTLFQFAQDYAFDSPSASAAVVSGTGLNGRSAWKLKGQGVSYKEWQEAQLDAASGARAEA